MKRLYFPLTLLVVSSLWAMEQYEQPSTANNSFTSIMGESLIQVGPKENPCIVIKEGTFFTEQNKIYVYKTDGTVANVIEPEKQLGDLIVACKGTDNQFTVPYGDGLGIFDIETSKLVIEFDTDEKENPATVMDFKFKNANTIIFTKKAPLGNYSYLFDTRSKGKPKVAFQWGYDVISSDCQIGVSHYNFPEPGYARTFNPEKNNIVQTLQVPSDLKLCTPNLLKMIAGKDSEEYPMTENIVYDTKTGEEITRWSIDSNWAFLTEQCSQDSRYLAQVTDSIINIYDLLGGKLVKTLEVPAKFMPFGLWFSPDNKQLVTVSNNSLIGEQEHNNKDINPNVNSSLIKTGIIAKLLKEEKVESLKQKETLPKEGRVDIWDINL